MPEIRPGGTGDNSPTFQRWVSGESECVSPEGTADSLPEVPFVVGNTMFLEQSQELFLESHFAMMVLLISDVLNGFLPQRLADAESAVLHLPAKQAVLRKGIMHPFGRPTLEELQRFGNRKSRGQR